MKAWDENVMKVHLIILLAAAVWTLIQIALFTYLAQRKDNKEDRTTK